MSNSKIRQDLPPPGGYKAIPYLRNPAKTYFNGVTMFAGFLVIQAGALYLFSLNHKMVEKLKVEERSSRISLFPLLAAEKDRAYLKVLRKLREKEAQLMKNVPGWEVGTYWGEPIYLTRPKDEWVDLSMNEFYVHNRPWEYKYSYNFYKWF